jgi:hypothetical protein
MNPQTPIEHSWPKHPDGRNKKMGEMTRDEQMAQWRRAAERFKQQVETPEAQAAFARVMSAAP